MATALAHLSKILTYSPHLSRGKPALSHLWGSSHANNLIALRRLCLGYQSHERCLLLTRWPVEGCACVVQQVGV
jgi:hypothetical protein